MCTASSREAYVVELNGAGTATGYCIAHMSFGLPGPLKPWQLKPGVTLSGSAPGGGAAGLNAGVTGSRLVG
jgi:hypothetical protein